MMYTSLNFILFSLIVVVIYSMLPHKYRSFFVVLINLYFCYLFGGKHLIVLLLSTLFSYGLALLLQKTRSKQVLIAGEFAIVLSLFFMKFGTVFGMQSILVPVGYSFYSLQMISFLCDVYGGKITSFRFVEYIQYMTYFPILLQGPICRFESMRKEFQKEVQFDFQRIKSGFMLMMFGVFKKLVIADRLAIFVNDVFTDYSQKSGGVLLLGVLFYAFQLYSDFSGCTDISRGISECLGITLPLNFRNPYFSLSIKEFWNRWHLSLSTWLKDYVYIPLGGNRKGTIRRYLHLIITFLVSGLWHGTGLQYLIWGVLQAVGQIVESLAEKRINWLRQTEKFSVALFRRVYVSLFTLGSWLVFRAHGVRAAVYMGIEILTDFYDFSGVLSCGLDQYDFVLSLLLIVFLIIVDFCREKNKDIRQKLNSSPYIVQCFVFLFLIFSVFVFGIYGSGYSASDFIYMQF